MILKQVRAEARKLARNNARRAEIIGSRDRLMRQAKIEGATWEELQTAAELASPKAVAEALKRGA